MSAALIIACEENYWPGALKVMKSFDDNTTYKYDIVIISRTIKQAPGMIVVPQTPKGNAEVGWLTDSFTWFEALKLHHGTLIIMDADQVVIDNVDELFDLPTGIHLAPANNDKYCTGLVVIEGGTQDERMEFYDELVEMIPQQVWRYGDQSLLNQYFIDNDINVGMLDKKYQHLKTYGNDGLMDAAIIHFHGQPKPWNGRGDIPVNLYDRWEKVQS